jgi:hypothetical protein
MAKTSALPADLGPDELDDMIRDLARELGCPPDVHPDLVELDHVPGHVYGLNTAMSRSGLDRYREGQNWRRKAIAELKRSPDWIADWRAARELNRQIQALCGRRGLKFMPWETAPWQVGDGPVSEGTDGTFGTYTRPAAQKLRRRLIRELEAEDRR